MKSAIASILRPLTIAACALAAVAAPPAAAQATAKQAGPAPQKKVDDSLYRALGGQAGVRRLADDVVPLLVADRRIGDAFRQANPQHLKELLAAQFCHVSGGGCAYDGTPINIAHGGGSEGDSNALVEVLQISMEDQGLPFPTQNRLLSRLGPTRRDVAGLD